MLDISCTHYLHLQCRLDIDTHNHAYHDGLHHSIHHTKNLHNLANQLAQSLWNTSIELVTTIPFSLAGLLRLARRCLSHHSSVLIGLACSVNVQSLSLTLLISLRGRKCNRVEKEW